MDNQLLNIYLPFKNEYPMRTYKDFLLFNIELQLLDQWLSVVIGTPNGY
jgi:hypothetical protein